MAMIAKRLKIKFKKKISFTINVNQIDHRIELIKFKFNEIKSIVNCVCVYPHCDFFSFFFFLIFADLNKQNEIRYLHSISLDKVIRESQILQISVWSRNITCVCVFLAHFLGLFVLTLSKN